MWRLVLQSLLISSLAISAIHNNLLKHGYFFHFFFFSKPLWGPYDWYIVGLLLTWSITFPNVFYWLKNILFTVVKVTVMWLLYFITGTCIMLRRKGFYMFFIYMDHQLLNCSVLLFLTKNKLWWFLLWHFIPLNCFIYLLPIPSYINSQLYMYIFYANVFIGHQRLKWWNSVMFCIVYNLLYINFIYIVIIYMIYLHYSYGLYFKFYLRLYLTVLLWYL